MQTKPDEIEQQGLIKSTFQQTLQAIDQRITYFNRNHISLESQLLKMQNDTPKTISDIIPNLGLYYFSESPVQPTIRDLYTSKYHPAHMQYRCVLPPPSQGEESVNQVQSKEPTFQWLARSIVDSTLLIVDQVEPKKIQKGRELPADWAGVTQLIIYNISKKIHIKTQAKSIDKYIYGALGKYSVVSIQKIRKIYYKGKPSALIKFQNQKSCCFAYFNLSICEDNNRKQYLGQNSEVFRIVTNNLKDRVQKKWVAVLFRRLPPNLTKETFLEILRKRNLSPVWMEDLIQIDYFKYTLCKVSYLDDVFQFCSCFQINPPIKEVKVNLHPKSCKIWKQDHQSFIPIS